jgi:excisionase family DNA binding protein
MTTKRRPPRLDASNELMTVLQVAEYLVCHPSTIYRLLKRRPDPGLQAGRELALSGL